MTANRIARYLISILSLLALLRAAPAWSFASFPDPGFAGGGITRKQLIEGGTTRAEAVAFDAEGRILVGGTLCSQGFTWCEMFVARLNQSGIDDSHFDVFVSGGPFNWFGFNMTTFSNLGLGRFAVATAMAIDSRGRIVLAGYLKENLPIQLNPDPRLASTDPAMSRMAVARFQSDGRLDESFGDHGLLVLDEGGLEQVEAMIIDNRVQVLPAGQGSEYDKIVLAGWSLQGNSRRVTLVRLFENGDKDPRFGIGGVWHFGGGRDLTATSIAMDGFGRYVVAGSEVYHRGDLVAPRTFVVRFNWLGLSVDREFGTDSVAWLPTSNLADNCWLAGAEQVLIDGHNRIVVLAEGRCSPQDSQDSFSTVYRLDSFGRQLDYLKWEANAKAMAIDARDRVVVVGNHDPDPLGGAAASVERIFDPAPQSADIGYNFGDSFGFRDGLWAFIRSVASWQGAAVDSNGRVVVVGYDQKYPRTIFDPEGRLVVARYLGEPIQWQSWPSGCPTCSYAPPAVCGNGLFEFTEFCDDGNTTVGDGCSATCEVESDADADGFLDEPFDYCVDVHDTQGFLSASLTLVKGATVESVIFRGEIQMPSGWRFEDFDPTSPDPYSGGYGIEVAVVNDVPSRIMAKVVMDDGPQRTWTHPTSTSWRFDNLIPDDHSPIVGVKLWDAGEGRVGVWAKARASAFRGGIGTGLDPLPLQAWITLGRRQGAGQHGECGETRFEPTECRLNGLGTKVTCMR